MKKLVMWVLKNMREDSEEYKMSIVSADNETKKQQKCNSFPLEKTYFPKGHVFIPELSVAKCTTSIFENPFKNPAGSFQEQDGMK